MRTVESGAARVLTENQRASATGTFHILVPTSIISRSRPYASKLEYKSDNCAAGNSVRLDTNTYKI